MVIFDGILAKFKAYQAKKCRILWMITLVQGVEDYQDKGALTVFFLARSPEAPSTTIVVFSFNSMVLSIATVSEQFPTRPRHRGVERKLIFGRGLAMLGELTKLGGGGGRAPTGEKTGPAW